MNWCRVTSTEGPFSAALSCSFNSLRNLLFSASKLTEAAVVSIFTLLLNPPASYVLIEGFEGCSGVRLFMTGDGFFGVTRLGMSFFSGAG